MLRENRSDSRGIRARLRHGFTLIELLVVVGIIAILVGILVPAVNLARESSHTAKCLSNLKQIGTAITQYAMDNDDCLVPADTFGKKDPAYTTGTADGKNPAGVGNWADILVFGNYLTAPSALYGGDEFLAGDTGGRDNVLHCPSGVDTNGVMDVNTGRPNSQTDAVGKFYFIRGSDVVGKAVRVWYGINSAPRVSLDDPTKKQTPFVVLPTNFMDSNGKPTATPQWGMHRFNQLKDNSRLPLIFDGIFMTNDDPNRINARHGSNQYTNILYADSHCETQKTSPTWPDVDWYLK